MSEPAEPDDLPLDGASEPKPSERFTGALLGVACGDALGAPIEFLSQAEAERRYGRMTDLVGGGMWAPGEWTDDTGMMLCIAEGILASPEDPVAETGRRFLEWRKTAKDVGSTISAALSGYEGNWAEASKSTHQALSRRAAGNGSLMRTAPVALAYADVEKMLRESARLSAMTHWDPQAELCCAVYCLWMTQILNGNDLADGFRRALEDALAWSAKGPLASDTPGPAPLPDGFWDRLERIPSLDYEDLQPSGYAGYSVECFEAAAWCCLESSSAEEAIVRVVNLAGEADTMGAVAGGIAGVFWGERALPFRWLDKLLDRERIVARARGLESLRERIHPGS
jgi:ADP-ribosylglycohydrolase